MARKKKVTVEPYPDIDVVPEPEPDSCVRCRFWHMKDEGLGLCRRYPPLPNVPVAVFPLVPHHFLCGEYSPK